MSLLVNDLYFSIETWDDPGDYPSGAGGGPLPSYDYPVVEGQAFFAGEPSSEELDAIVPDGFACKFDVRHTTNESHMCDSVFVATPNLKTLVLQTPGE